MRTPEQIAGDVLLRYNMQQYDSSLSLRDVLADALTRYAEAAVAADRARALQAMISASNDLGPDASTDYYLGYKDAIANAIAAIRALE